MSGSPNEWLPAVLRGDFTAIPSSFGWATSAEFAHLIDGYEVFGGAEPGLRASKRILLEISRAGSTSASALDLWAALFIQHRGYRMGGYGPNPEAELDLNGLCRCLREHLIVASSPEKIRILTAVAAARWPLGGAEWRP